MFDDLTYKLEGIFKKLKGHGKLTEDNISEALKEVRRAFLEADVNYKVAKDFIASVREKALGTEVLHSITPGQQIIKIIHEELVNLLGSKAYDVQVSSSPPTIVMIVGLQGSGKTTMCGKLSLHFRKKNKSPLLVAADIYRPAAVDQLRILGKSINMPVFHIDDNPVKIAKASLKAAAEGNNDVIIIDTAGRLHIDNKLMTELEDIKSTVSPDEILLIADAMTGQDAVNIAEVFNKRLDLTGVILTKMDGDARGGAALSIKMVTGKPIKLIGIGEKLSDLEVFHPDRLASRILGMGDILTLVEKAQEAVDFREAEKLQKKHDDFTVLNILGMAACYSPNPAAPPFGIDLPVDLETGEFREEVWSRWLALDPALIVERHAGALRTLKLLHLDCGTRDEWHLHLGLRKFVRQLEALGVPHEHEEFDDGHMNVSYRYDVSLPKLARALGAE